MQNEYYVIRGACYIWYHCPGAFVSSDIKMVTHFLGIYILLTD